MSVLRERALSPKWGSPWATAEDFYAVDSPTYRSVDGGTVELEVSLRKVQGILARELKPTRTLLDVVLFRDGTIQDATLTVENPTAEEDAGSLDTWWDSVMPRLRAATSVAQPIQGCPAPDFMQSDIRANRVLETFLTPEQVEDFRKHNKFVSTGGKTGHRYMLTSRHQRRHLDQYGGRTLYDLDEQRSFCVHDWTIPPAEELLSLHLFLKLRESYLRAIPAN